MANPQNFKPTIERLLKRPTWAIGDGRALVACLRKGGCDAVIDIELPKTLDEARDRIRAQGWTYEPHNGLHLCPKHGKEFYMSRTRQAQKTIQAKMNKADARKFKGDAHYTSDDALTPKRGDLLAGVAWPQPNDPSCPIPPIPLPGGTGGPTPAASRGLRKMFTLLDDHFEVKRGRYVPGWSDQKVANECGLAVSAVVHYREGAYGVLRTVDEQTLREIKRLDAALNDLQAKMGLIRNDLEAIKGKVK